MMIRLNFKYSITFLFLFFTEVCIALFVHDTIIRPYIGDVLVIILMYTFIRGLIPKRIRYLSIYLFIFAAFIEFIQLIHILDMLNLQGNRALSIILGSTFDWKDIACYLVAMLILLLWESFERKRTS
jgi:hypothetical protein